MKPLLPTRQGRETRHLQNKSFLLRVYRSDQTIFRLAPPPPRSFFYKFRSQSHRGHCLITLGLDQSWRSKRESRRSSFLTAWGLNLKQHLGIIGHVPEAPAEGGGAAGGGKKGWWTCSNLVDKIQKKKKSQSQHPCGRSRQMIGWMGNIRWNTASKSARLMSERWTIK